MKKITDTATLMNMAKLGSNIIINADDFSTFDIINIARTLASTSTLTIKKAYALSDFDLQSIARLGYRSSSKNNIIFDFS